MKKILLNFFFVLMIFYSTAQTVDNTIIANYPKSVILRVHNVASKISLTTTEQTALADLFQDEENDLAALVISGASPTVIDSVKNNYKAEFNSLLAPTQLANYYKATVSAKATTTGHLMAAMLKHKYIVDTTIEHYFDSILNWRESAVEKIWLRETDPTTRNNNLAYSYYIYDSLLSVYTNTAASGSYFGSRVYYLDSIQPVDSLKKIALGTNYYNNCIAFKYRAYADNFNAAFNAVFNNISDTPYYNLLYKSEIANNTKNAAAVALAGYIKRDKVSTYTAQLIAPILLQQQRVIAFVNKIYPTYTASKDSIIDTLTINYQRHIDEILAQDGNLHNASQIDIAIKYAAELSLNASQVSSLQEGLTQLNALRADYKESNPAGEYDSKAFESVLLNAKLHQDQYTQVLTIKYSDVANNLANTDWSELVRMDLNEGLEEAPTKTELANYHLAVLIAYYRNANNTELQYSSVRSINRMMPTAMQTLLNKWDYNTPYTDTIDTFFQW